MSGTHTTTLHVCGLSSLFRILWNMYCSTQNIQCMESFSTAENCIVSSCGKITLSPRSVWWMDRSQTQNIWVSTRKWLQGDASNEESSYVLEKDVTKKRRLFCCVILFYRKCHKCTLKYICSLPQIKFNYCDKIYKLQCFSHEISEMLKFHWHCGSNLVQKLKGFWADFHDVVHFYQI